MHAGENTFVVAEQKLLALHPQFERTAYKQMRSLLQRSYRWNPVFYFLGQSHVSLSEQPENATARRLLMQRLPKVVCKLQQ